MNWYAYLLSNEYATYCQSKQDHIDVIKESVRSLVQDYLIKQARTILDKLLTDSSQYYKVETSENTFSALVILQVR